VRELVGIAGGVGRRCSLVERRVSMVPAAAFDVLEPRAPLRD
jgi:hypothetical protein